MFEYQDYLREFDIITFDECEDIYHRLRESIDRNDEDEIELFQDLLERIMDYASIRSRWFSVMSRNKRMEEDEGRTIIHNSVIRGFNILARYQESKGTDNSWRDDLGEDIRRKRIGDFACYIAFMYGINGR
ncbi:MAG: hypothetical protein Q4B47_04690 [Eubacteriales bacterium]|nr:hypothetical protein [Eubacteriales bacterium]